MSFGLSELLLIIIIAIVCINPKKVKPYLKKWYEMKRDFEDIKGEIDKEVSDVKSTIQGDWTTNVQS